MTPPTWPPKPPPWPWLTGLPNVLSGLRLVLALAFPFVPVSWRLPVVVVAAVSDLADGALSRWLDARTDLGQLLDPVADKLFVLSVLITLLVETTLSIGDVLLLGVRDVVIGLGGLWLLLRGGRGAAKRLKPSWLGKAATVGLFVFLVSLLMYGERLTLLFVGAVGLSSAAALDYLRRFLWAAPQDRHNSSHSALM